MNNILTLYDMEFKRIYKIYFTLIGLLFVSNIGATLYNIFFRSLYRIKNVNR